MSICCFSGFSPRLLEKACLYKDIKSICEDILMCTVSRLLELECS